MNRGFVWSLRIGALSVALLLLSPMASAVEAGFYVGAFYGLAESSMKVAGFDQIAQDIYASGNFNVTESSSSLDTKDSGFAFFGGYRFSRHLAFEGGYLDLGKYVYREQSTGNFVSDPEDTEPQTFHQKIDVISPGLMVAALGILPVNYRFEVYGRGGFIYATNKLTAHVDDTSIGELHEGNVTYLAGLGGSFTFADIYAVRLEYLRVFDAGDSHWGKADVDMLTLGLAVTF